MSAGQLSAREAGTEAGGFRVGGAPHSALRIEAWGYWSSEVASKFAREAASAVKNLSPAATFVLDAPNLKPQSAEGQEALRALFRGLSALTFAEGKIVASNALTCMQLMRLLRECKMDERLTFGNT